MKMPRYVVIRLDTKANGTKIEVTATDISDRCEVYEYEEADTPQTEQNCDECQWWFQSYRDDGYCQRKWYNLECKYEPQTDCAWGKGQI